MVLLTTARFGVAMRIIALVLNLASCVHGANADSLNAVNMLEPRQQGREKRVLTKRVKNFHRKILIRRELSQQKKPNLFRLFDTSHSNIVDDGNDAPQKKAPQKKKKLNIFRSFHVLDNDNNRKDEQEGIVTQLHPHSTKSPSIINAPSSTKTPSIVTPHSTKSPTIVAPHSTKSPSIVTPHSTKSPSKISSTKMPQSTGSSKAPIAFSHDHSTKSPSQHHGSTKAPHYLSTKAPQHPTHHPTLSPSKNPTHHPTLSPSKNPTPLPSKKPTTVPTLHPSEKPSSQPTSVPHILSTKSPQHHEPSYGSTKAPHYLSTKAPHHLSTKAPHHSPHHLSPKTPHQSPHHPSLPPSTSSSSAPVSLSSNPTTMKPSTFPSSWPFKNPSAAPSFGGYSVGPSSHPSISSSDAPSPDPSISSSNAPSSLPSNSSSNAPSSLPSISSSNAPSSLPSVSLTSLPSSYPSDKPFMAQEPSEMPSVYPSKNPTHPTNSPSSVPSLYPSETPSAQPAGTSSSHVPSTQPSNNPSLRPTIMPSASPTLQPSALPSFSPSTVPSPVPTIVDPCEISNGSFGDTSGQNSLIVSFSYGIEYDHNEIVINEVKPALSHQVNDVEEELLHYLIGDFFPQCSNDRRLKSNAQHFEGIKSGESFDQSSTVSRLASELKDDIVGFSAFPVDLANGRKCNGDLNNTADMSTECDIIDGKLTVYLSDMKFADDISIIVFNTIRTIMNEHELDRSMVSVKFFTDIQMFADIPSDDDSGESTETLSSRIGTETWIVSAIGGTALVVLAGVTSYRYSKRQRLTEEAPAGAVFIEVGEYSEGSQSISDLRSF